MVAKEWNMAKKLFRHNEEELGTSPEQLQHYVRVTNPLVWTVLIAVALLLAGGIVAANFAKVETTMYASAYVESKLATIDIPTPDALKVKEGMKVRFTDQGAETTIETIEWVSPNLAEASFTIDLPDTTQYPYPCLIVTGTVSPIDFLLH